MIFSNHANLCGKVVKDPIFAKTKSDKSVCKIILVVEKSIGGVMKRSDYIPVALWGKKADVANDIVQRGDIMLVEGTVAQERWETKDHDKRSRIVVQADKFWVIPSHNHNDNNHDEDEEYDIDEEGIMEDAEERMEEVTTSGGFFGS